MNLPKQNKQTLDPRNAYACYTFDMSINIHVHPAAHGIELGLGRCVGILGRITVVGDMTRQ